MSLRIAGTAWGAVVSAAALVVFVASARADSPRNAKPPAQEKCGDCAGEKHGKTDRRCCRDAKPEDAKPEDAKAENTKPENAKPEKGADCCRMGRGPGRGGPAPGGMGPGGPGRMGHGRDAAWERDHDVFFRLLDQRGKIRRTVRQLPDGVETLTESDDAEVAAAIREHVAAMHARLKEGRPIHLRDPLFRAVFGEAGRIDMAVEKTDKGVRVRETSKDPYAVRLIQAHAAVVDLFVGRGRAEMRRDHAVPERPAAPAPEARPDGR